MVLFFVCGKPKQAPAGRQEKQMLFPYYMILSIFAPN